MSNPTPVFLHHNRGVPKLAFTIRQERAIKFVSKTAFTKVVEHQDGRTFLITKGLCNTVARLGRLKLTPFTGRFPMLVLFWRRLLEVLRG